MTKKARAEQSEEEKKRQHSIEFPEPTLTKQSFGSETNINNIMARYEKTGVIEHVQNNQGEYGDFSNIPDYQEALNRIKHAENQFQNLPARVRKEFDNSPVKFMEFVQNPDNAEKFEELGLTKRPAKAEAVRQAKEGEALSSPSNEAKASEKEAQEPQSKKD